MMKNDFMRFANRRSESPEAHEPATDSDDDTMPDAVARAGLAVASMVLAAMRGRIDQDHLQRLLNNVSSGGDAYQMAKDTLTTMGERFFADLVKQDENEWKEKLGS